MKKEESGLKGRMDDFQFVVVSQSDKQAPKPPKKLTPKNK